ALEVLSEAVDGQTHAGHGQHITVEHQAYLTIWQRDVIPISKKCRATHRVLAFEIPHAKQAESNSAAAGQRIGFFLAFGNPEGCVGISEEWLTSWGAIETDPGAFGQQILP